MINKISVFLISLFTLINVCNANEKLDGIAAVVNDEIITHSMLNKQYTQVRKDLVRRGEIVPSAKALKLQVLQHLVDIQLQVQEARKFGIHIKKEAVDQAIKNIANQNKISVRELKQRLASDGFQYDIYRDNIKQQMIMSEIQRKMISDRIKITPQQISNEYEFALKKQDAANEFHVKNILVPVSDSPSSREMIKAKQKAELIYMQLQKGAPFDGMARAESSDSTALSGGDLGWRTLNALPEVFLKQVKKMKVGQVTHPISTPNGFHILKLVAKRNAIKPHHKTLYQVRHILYRAAKGDYSDSVKKRIQVLEKEIHKTGKFAELAKKYSEDIMSGEKGGNIGWIDARDMTPAFANAVRKLPLHKMSKPIRSQFGWHLIEVTGKKQVDDRMEVFKERIAEQLFHREFESKMKDWIQTLRSRSYIVVKTA